VDGWEFCPACGTQVARLSTTASVDIYIQNKVKLELADRLKDQNVLVRELGDKVEDIVWKRLRIYGGMIALLVTVVAFFGIKGFNDLTKPVEEKVQAVNQKIEDTARRLPSIEATLDKLSTDVEAQREHAAKLSVQIAGTLDTLTVAANRASARLEAMTKDLQNRVGQVAQQVDNLSVHKAFPGLGQQRFVSFQNAEWKGKAAKSATDRWVNVVIDPWSYGAFTDAQVEKLTTALRDAGYTPFLGSFGIGGPTATNWNSFAPDDKTSVFYFKPSTEKTAADVGGIVSMVFSTGTIIPRLVDSSTFPTIDGNESYVIENSGLDFQIVLHR
jgi:hypothetical protein